MSSNPSRVAVRPAIPSLRCVRSHFPDRIDARMGPGVRAAMLRSTLLSTPACHSLRLPRRHFFPVYRRQLLQLTSAAPCACSDASLFGD